MATGQPGDGQVAGHASGWESAARWRSAAIPYRRPPAESRRGATADELRGDAWGLQRWRRRWCERLPLRQQLGRRSAAGAANRARGPGALGGKWWLPTTGSGQKWRLRARSRAAPARPAPAARCRKRAAAPLRAPGQRSARAAARARRQRDCAGRLELARARLGYPRRRARQQLERGQERRGEARRGAAGRPGRTSQVRRSSAAATPAAPCVTGCMPTWWRLQPCSVCSRPLRVPQRLPPPHVPRCDKCDGPHETAACPWFRKARDRHPDAAPARDKKHLGGASGPVEILRSARVVRRTHPRHAPTARHAGCTHGARTMHARCTVAHTRARTLARTHASRPGREADRPVIPPRRSARRHSIANLPSCLSAGAAAG